MASCPHGVQQPSSLLITVLSHSTVRKHCEEHSLAPCCPVPCSGRGPLGQSAPRDGCCEALWDGQAGTGAAWGWAALIASTARGEQARSYVTCAGLLASPAHGRGRTPPAVLAAPERLCSVQPVQRCA